MGSIIAIDFSLFCGNNCGVGSVFVLWCWCWKWCWKCLCSVMLVLEVVLEVSLFCGKDRAAGSVFVLTVSHIQWKRLLCNIVASFSC